MILDDVRSEHERTLWEQLEENDTVTLEEHCQMFEKKRGIRVSVATMSRAVRKLGWTFKKDRWEPQKETRVEQLIEAAGSALLFLPPYSPDFNPIEEAFSKIKSILRKASSRTKEALLEATGRALDAITPEDISGFYSDCGYRLPAQSF